MIELKKITIYMEVIMKKQEEKTKIIYAEAIKFLYKNAPEGISAQQVEEYFNISKNFKTKNDILFRLLSSLQNRQMVSNIIGFNNIQRQPIFNYILFEYDCNKILNTYNEETLFEKFQDNFAIKNIESRSNLWRRYASSVISACEFLNKFNDAKDFDNFVKIFTYNELSSASLPMLLKIEIDGIGFPLACDFLKELGYDQYPKPDVHIIDIFSAFGLCENNEYSAYKAVIEMANLVNATPYKVDKIFWLIGSGNYYYDNIRGGANKQNFIEAVKEILNSNYE